MLRNHPFSVIVQCALVVQGSYIPIILKPPATIKEVNKAYGWAGNTVKHI